MMLPPRNPVICSRIFPTFAQVMAKSIFEILPKDVIFEVLAALPAQAVSTFVSTCKDAAGFAADSSWYYEWVARNRGYGHALVSAIRSRDVPGLRRLLARAPEGFDVNAPLAGPGTVVTLLHHAIDEGHAGTLAELIQTPGLDVNRIHALHIAVRSGKDMSVAVLLRCPAVDPNARDEGGMTALHLAAGLSNVNAMVMLVYHSRTDVNATITGMSEGTALHSAVNALDAGMVTALLLQHPDLDANKRNKYGETALHEAAHGLNIQAMRTLLADWRVDVNARDARGNTALHVVAERMGSEERAVEAARLLLGVKGVDVNAQCGVRGATALHKAAQKNHGAMVRLLVGVHGD